MFCVDGSFSAALGSLMSYGVLGFLVAILSRRHLHGRLAWLADCHSKQNSFGAPRCMKVTLAEFVLSTTMHAEHVA